MEGSIIITAAPIKIMVIIEVIILIPTTKTITEARPESIHERIEGIH